MEPATCPPTDELRQSISTILDAYVAKVTKINYERLCTAVHDVDADWDTNPTPRSDEEQAESIQERISDFQDEFLNGEYNGPELTDLVTNITDLLNLDIACRILPPVIDPPMTPQQCEKWMSKIESELQAQAKTQPDGSDSNIALPNDYLVLMSLCDGIDRPGLYNEVQERGFTAIGSPCIVKIPPLDELEVLLCIEPSGYTVYAGFITEPNCDHGDIYVGWALCERAATGGAGGVRERRKAWRIMLALNESCFLYVFDSIEEFLRWYAGYSVRNIRSWDDEDAVYLDDDGNPIDESVEDTIDGLRRL